MSLYEEKKKLSIDDPRTTEMHREIILQAPFLKAIYTSWYSDFGDYLGSVPPGIVLEIGAGGGFSKEVIPNILTSDIQKLPFVDMQCSADNIPLENESVSALFMVNVLHHIPDATKFFEEARRVLKPGGIVYMIEPARTLVSSVIYRFLHHEPYAPNAKDWKINGDGPLSDANIAIPWMIFKRDYDKFKSQFPDLRREKLDYHTPFRYLLSGGVSRPSFLPYSLYGCVRFLETLNAPFARLNAMFSTIIVRKRT
jgi:SAM-dependent methyltransferase